MFPCANAAEAALNRALQHAPETRQKLAAQAGEVFALHCSSPDLDIFLEPTETGVRLMGVYDGPITSDLPPKYVMSKAMMLLVPSDTFNEGLTNTFLSEHIFNEDGGEATFDAYGWKACKGEAFHLKAH